MKISKFIEIAKINGNTPTTHPPNSWQRDTGYHG